MSLFEDVSVDAHGQVGVHQDSQDPDLLDDFGFQANGRYMSIMVRVLIVDDSAFMRNILSPMLSSDHEISIAGTARDGREAIEKIEKLRPDVVTMDVEMPKMDGITAGSRGISNI